MEHPLSTAPQGFEELENPFEEPIDPRKESTDPHIPVVKQKAEMLERTFENEDEIAPLASKQDGHEELDNPFEDQEKTLLSHSTDALSAQEEFVHLFPLGSRSHSGALIPPSSVGSTSGSLTYPSSLPRSLLLSQVGSLMGGRERAATPGWQRWWPGAAACIILLIALLYHALMVSTEAPTYRRSTSSQIIGSTYFFSSDIIDATNSKGMNDGLQI